MNFYPANSYIHPKYCFFNHNTVTNAKKTRRNTCFGLFGWMDLSIFAS
jgi:hypothetical protein